MPTNDANQPDELTLYFDTVWDEGIRVVRPKDWSDWVDICNCRTWGELRTKCGEVAYQWMIERMGGPPLYDSFDVFFEEAYDGDEERRAEAAADWASHFPDTRAPAPDDPFDVDAWNVGNPDCLITGSPGMDWVPQDIQERFGATDRNGNSVLKDPVLVKMIEESDRIHDSHGKTAGEPPVAETPAVEPLPYMVKDGEPYPHIDSPLIAAFESHGYRCFRSLRVRWMAGYTNYR